MNIWKKYRAWVIIIRLLLMGTPAALSIIFEWLFNKTECLLMWLDHKLPNPEKRI